MSKEIVAQDDGLDFLDMMPMMMVMMMAMMMVMWPTMQQVSAMYGSMQAQQYLGILNSIELVADPTLRIYNVTDPYPWSYMIVKNVSTSPLYLGINTPDAMVMIKAGDIYRVDRISAAMRIVSIYYQAPPTKQVTFRIDYEY